MATSSVIAIIEAYRPRVKVEEVGPGCRLIIFPEWERWQMHNRGNVRKEPPEYKLYGIPAGVNPGDQKTT